MPLNEPALISTEPDFYYKVIGEIEESLEASTIFHETPTVVKINQHLRKKAIALGADAVINVRYERGMSWTSWRRLTASGTAVKKAI